MMQVAFSALKHSSANAAQNKAIAANRQRMQGYHAACHKYQQELQAIRRYLPNWAPPLPGH